MLPKNDVALEGHGLTIPTYCTKGQFAGSIAKKKSTFQPSVERLITENTQWMRARGQKAAVKDL